MSRKLKFEGGGVTPEKRAEIEARIKDLEAQKTKFISSQTQPTQQVSNSSGRFRDGYDRDYYSVSENPLRQQAENDYYTRNIGRGEGVTYNTEFNDKLANTNIGGSTHKEIFSPSQDDRTVNYNAVDGLMSRNNSLKRGDLSIEQALRTVDKANEHGLKASTGRVSDQFGNRITEKDGYSDVGRLWRGLAGKKNLLEKRTVRDTIKLTNQLAGNSIFDATTKDVAKGKVNPFQGVQTKKQGGTVPKYQTGAKNEGYDELENKRFQKNKDKKETETTKSDNNVSGLNTKFISNQPTLAANTNKGIAEYDAMMSNSGRKLFGQTQPVQELITPQQTNQSSGQETFYTTNRRNPNWMEGAGSLPLYDRSGNHRDWYMNGQQQNNVTSATTDYDAEIAAQRKLLSDDDALKIPKVETPTTKKKGSGSGTAAKAKLDAEKQAVNDYWQQTVDSGKISEAQYKSAITRKDSYMSDVFKNKQFDKAQTRKEDLFTMSPLKPQKTLKGQVYKDLLDPEGNKIGQIYPQTNVFQNNRSINIDDLKANKTSNVTFIERDKVKGGAKQFQFGGLTDKQGNKVVGKKDEKAETQKKAKNEEQKKLAADKKGKWSATDHMKVWGNAVDAAGAVGTYVPVVGNAIGTGVSAVGLGLKHAGNYFDDDGYTSDDAIEGGLDLALLGAGAVPFASDVTATGKLAKIGNKLWSGVKTGMVLEGAGQGAVTIYNNKDEVMRISKKAINGEKLTPDEAKLYSTMVTSGLGVAGGLKSMRNISPGRMVTDDESISRALIEAGKSTQPVKGLLNKFAKNRVTLNEKEAASELASKEKRSAFMEAMNNQIAGTKSTKPTNKKPINDISDEEFDVFINKMEDKDIELEFMYDAPKIKAKRVEYDKQGGTVKPRQLFSNGGLVEKK